MKFNNIFGELMNGHNIVSSICVRDDKKYPLLATTHLASDKSKSLKRIKVFNTFSSGPGLTV